MLQRAAANRRWGGGCELGGHGAPAAAEPPHAHAPSTVRAPGASPQRRPRPITASGVSRRCAGAPEAGAKRLDGAPLFRPRLLPADAEPSAGPLFPFPRRVRRSRHRRAPRDPARRPACGVAGSLNFPAREEMDAAFRDIAALSSEKGCRAILDEAAWHFASDRAAHAAFVAQLAARANHFERAMTTFLDHPACWRGATRFYQAEAAPRLAQAH